VAETTPGTATSPPIADAEAPTSGSADDLPDGAEVGSAQSADIDGAPPAHDSARDAGSAPSAARYELVPRRSGLARRVGGRSGRAGELVQRARRVATHPAVVASGAAVGTLAARAGLVALQRVVVRHAAAQVAAQAAGQVAGRSLGNLAAQPTGTLVTRTLGQLAEQPQSASSLPQPVTTATHVLVRLVVVVRQP
jgi:hypothetical protein